jgi:hypothetical protein
VSHNNDDLRRPRSRISAVGADIEQPPVDPAAAEGSGADASALLRSKKNEVDFTIAPADVSLSQAYGRMSGSSSSTTTTTTTTAAASTEEAPVSLTLALNNASNRAVRRILLARSWPSPEALNWSLQQVAQAERRAQEQTPSSGGAKCPVPRPILNVLTRQRRNAAASKRPSPVSSRPKSRTDAEYVADQVRSFRARYGKLTNYDQAEDYLEAVLSLATAGVESTGVAALTEETGASHLYQNSYRRFLGVLRTVGVVWAADESRRRIAPRLRDQNICLSMLDRIQLQKEEEAASTSSSSNEDAVATAVPESRTTPPEDKADATKQDEEEYEVTEDGATVFKPRLKFFGKDNKSTGGSETGGPTLTEDHLGGILLSAKEPSMTRQLNVLSNIALRALLFGGDQELLVLAETLDADRTAFVERWYPKTGGLLNDSELKQESRPGVQYLNCLVDLLREAYENGVVVDLQPSFPLANSYTNAYDRLVATAVELGSGYIKPAFASGQGLPKPKTAKEELGRFALWETNFRKSGTPDVSSYPEDLVGVWEVRDEIGGETIGKTKVRLLSEGQVKVEPPLEGLRWRLDPGPTHLDTCTFQVLNSDGTILQYRGFMDRGARLEARFSKRSMRIRGSVQFQMRDGSVDYYKDILPINYREGTTKFVMTQVSDNA